MTHRRARTALTAAALAAASLGFVEPVQALEPPVAFSAVAQPSYQTNNVAWKVVQTNGLVIVGGSFTSIRPPGAAAGTDETTRRGLAVLDASTGTPTSCAPSFTLPASPSQAAVRALAVSPDGSTLYVGGRFSHVNGVDQPNLAAINLATCTLVTGFRPVPNFTVHTLLARGSTLYFGGEFGKVGTTTRGFVAAVSAVSTATPGGLLPWAPTFDKAVLALTVQPGGDAMAVGGRFEKVDAGASHAIAVVSASTGAVLRRYGSTFIHPLSVVKALAADDTGFYTGNEGTGGGVFDGRIAFDWSTLDQRWRDACLGATQAVLPFQGLLYSASHAHDCSSIGAFPDGVRHHLLAQSLTARNLAPWYPNTNDGTGESLGPRDLAVTPGTPGPTLWVVGEFTTVNGLPQQGITRFGQSLDAVPVAPTLTLTTDRAGEVRVAWRQATDNDNANLTYRVYRDGGTTPILTTSASSVFWQRRQMSLVDTLPANSTHTYQVTASDGNATVATPVRSIKVSAATSAYATRVRADGAGFLWRYDDTTGGHATDHTTNDQGGSLRALVTATTGAISGDASRAGTLGGANSTIYTETRFPQPAAYSLETWFRTAATDGGKIIGFGNKQTFPSALADKHVYMRNDGRLVFGVQPGSPPVQETLTSATAYNDDAWHHLVATQGPGGMALYVDGERVASNAVTGNRSFEGYWRVGGDRIDAAWPGKPASEFWRGTLDETAVYPTALTADRIRAHYWLGRTGDPTERLPPTVPQNVTATASRTTDDVTLAWQASGDNVGVTRYEVYRSATASVPSDGTPLGTATGTSFTDTPPGDGTWYYVVRARDAAGNRSAPSSVASAVVGAGQPVSLSLNPVADAYGNSQAPGTNFGTSSSLVSRGTAAASSFLRFQLPEPPAGKALASATLRIRTNTDPTAGSQDAHPLRLGSDSWDETALTWANRPAVEGATLGSVQGAVAPDTWYDVVVDPAALAPALGTRRTVAVTSSGTDSLIFWSRDFPGGDRRPRLTLTFG